MTTKQMGQEKAIQMESLRAGLIKEAARRQDSRKDGESKVRVDRKWWQSFCVAHA